MNPENIDPTHALGFHKAGFFDKIIDIQQCWLQEEPSNELRNTCRAIALEQELAFYDMRKHTGFLRNLMVRLTTTGETDAAGEFCQKRPWKPSPVTWMPFWKNFPK
jgi:23S rRNA (uracil1939-C5)-methyltransferase